MTTEMSLDQGWVPEACTLPTTQRPLRLAEFDALFATTVQYVQRLDPTRLRMTLAGPADLAATVRDLTARERQCCSFFTFTVTAGRPGHVVLDIGVPSGHVDILDALAQRAAGRDDR